MARRSYILVVCILFLLSKTPTPTNACRRCSRARAFLEASCRPTHYQKLCVETLMSSINHEKLQSTRELAQLALTASLKRAHRAQDYITQMAVQLKGGEAGLEYQAVLVCVDQIRNSIDQISQSIQELQRIKDSGSVDEFTWHSGNVITWTSTALTDQNTCLYTFPGGQRGRRVQAAVSAQLDDVARFTSNALALVNRFVMRHRLGRGIRAP